MNCKAGEKRSIQPIQNCLVPKNSPTNECNWDPTQPSEAISNVQNVESGTWARIAFVSSVGAQHVALPVAAPCVLQTGGDIKLGRNDEWNWGTCLDYPKFLMYNWIILVSIFQALWFLASVFNYSAPSCPCALLCCSLAFSEATEVWLLNKVAYERERMLFILPLNNLNGALFFNQCLIVQ